MPENGEIKRYRRFAGWDYAKGVSLFITIATEPRRVLFGVVRDGVVVLSSLGEKVKEALEGNDPVLCEVFVDYAQNFEPKLSSKALPDGSMVSPPIDDMFPFLDREEFDAIKASMPGKKEQ